MSQAEENLGHIVMRLCDYADFVRVNKETSVLSQGIIIVKGMKVVNKVTYTLSEAISLETLEQINSVEVVADAMIEKLKRTVNERG